MNAFALKEDQFGELQIIQAARHTIAKLGKENVVRGAMEGITRIDIAQLFVKDGPELTIAQPDLVERERVAANGDDDLSLAATAWRSPSAISR